MSKFGIGVWGWNWTHEVRMCTGTVMAPAVWAGRGGQGGWQWSVRQLLQVYHGRSPPEPGSCPPDGGKIHSLQIISKQCSIHTGFCRTFASCRERKALHSTH